MNIRRNWNGFTSEQPSGRKLVSTIFPSIRHDIHRRPLKSLTRRKVKKVICRIQMNEEEFKRYRVKHMAAGCFYVGYFAFVNEYSMMENYSYFFSLNFQWSSTTNRIVAIWEFIDERRYSRKSSEKLLSTVKLFSRSVCLLRLNRCSCRGDEAQQFIANILHLIEHHICSLRDQQFACFVFAYDNFRLSLANQT